ncbi:NUDIX domain-containing protein [Candidatus Gottesmanbacteria bacterium]|nr:NUDIX domain-containing protein [Candidatus Gottesmanbacteria bacterium]
MKTEISAGGIIVRKYNNSWKVLLIKDMNGNWTFPKGIIEKNEDTERAAKREISEEVGIFELKTLKKLDPFRYKYTRDSNLIQKTVHYYIFLFHGFESPRPQIAEGISAVQWIEIYEAKNSIGYEKTNVPLLEDVTSFLSTYGH